MLVELEIMLGKLDLASAFHSPFRELEHISRVVPEQRRLVHF